MKITYNRNSMFATIAFLRKQNPTAAKMTELDLLRDIEKSMMDCADDDESTYRGTMGYLVIKDDWGYHFAHFDIVVDPSVCMPYESVSIEYSCR